MSWIKQYGLKEMLIVFLALFVIFHLLLLMALPIEALFSVFLGFVILYLAIDYKNVILVSVTLLVFFILFEILLNVTGSDESVYYRPHEKFMTYDPELSYRYRYKPNIDHKMNIPHGDLKALVVSEYVNVAPRNVEFKTDSLGFRNNKDYKNQKYILVGDSFIVGNGTTQSDILTEQLLNDYDVDSYALAFPADVVGYLGFITEFEAKEHASKKYFLFVYEGNDFNNEVGVKKLVPEVKESSVYSDVTKKIEGYRKEVTRDSGTYKLIYSLLARVFSEDGLIVSYKISNKSSMAFYKKHNLITKRDELFESENIENTFKLLENKISHVFFIPTKYRVYHELILDNNPNVIEGVLPDRQWEFIEKIANKYNFEATNLTPDLISKSKELILDDELTYWPDDTHWNGHGISVAARKVAELVK